MRTSQTLLWIGAWTLATSVAGCQPKDVEGWSNLKWGMTVTEAKRVFGDQASEPTEKPGPNFVLIDRIIVKNIRIGDTTASAAIQTKRNSDVVTAVTIEAAGLHDPRRADIFTMLKTMLIEKYGTPKNEDRKADGRGNTDSTVVWSFPSTSIMLLWSEASPRYGFGYVTIRYEAVDKKALDAL